MDWKEWLVDGSCEPQDEMLVFCPIEEGGSVITGMMFMSTTPPEGGIAVGVWHPDGAVEADKWAKRNWDLLSKNLGWECP